ncbi:TonB-dependent receptor [Henriciella sp.]|uniref:TonB-dependent receptor n=1 Tax=Henriciella sp. TaxID=1968823 RepID=UPI002602AE52|nr:TonB-dependent receptor [Henriciella sp.]
MGMKTGLRRQLLGAVAVSMIAGAGTAAAQDGRERTEVTIEAASLAEALQALSAQTGTPIMFSRPLVAGRDVEALEGDYSPEEALERLLAGSGLVAVRGGGEALIVRKAPDAPVPGRERAPERTPVAPVEVPGPAGTETDQESALRIDTVRVTGTSLRGFAPESSPLQVYDREDLLQSAASSTEQFIRQLPQNFSGGSTEFAAGQGLPNDRNSQSNNTYGTGANLRGLGSGATLTLLNGNRVAPTSTIGDFVDLSLIPVSALERVEVLTDGASSIYGGDAVAGVINLVLRDDFEGAETALRYGTVTSGDLDAYRFSQSAGTAWDSGNLLAVYEYSDRGNLTLSERPDIAVPPLSGGDPITLTDVFDLLPAQTRNSLVLSANQEVGRRLDFSSTLLYSDREVDSRAVGIGSFASAGRNRIGSESLTFNLGAEYRFSDRWILSLDGNYSQIRNDRTSRILSPVPRDPSRQKTESDLWSAGVLLNGDLFELPGGQVRAAMGGQVRQERFRVQQAGSPALRDGERDVSSVYAEVLFPLIGPGNAQPLADRVELNLSGRIDDYSDFGSTSNPKIGLLWAPVDGLNLRSSYSTSFAPPALGQAGALDRIAGVLPYDFIRGIFGIELPDPSLAGVNYIQANGTAPDLEPETSRTFTAGIDYEVSSGVHDWSLSSSYYDINFEDRLGATPIPGNLNSNFAPGLAFDNPDLFPAGTVIFFPTDVQIDALLASLSRPVILAGGATAVENIGFINRVNLTRNLASTETRGIDLQLGYSADAEIGRVSAGINANYIIDFVKQAAETTPAVETLNTLYNPVDLQLRAHLGLSRGGFTGNFFVNYTDDYRIDGTADARRIGSWITADLSLSYDFGEDRTGWLSGTVFNLSATNLFDESPPSAPPLSGFALTGYDPANASPIGRFVSVEVRKTF